MKSTPLKNTLLCKMIALLLALVLMLPLFYFRSHAAEGDGEPEILYEDVSKRSETEKHFVCSDGSMIAVAYAQEVHQPDGKGGFEDLDNRLTLNSKTGRYENTGNRRFSVSLATTSAGSPVTVQGEGAPTLSMVTRVIKDGRILSPELLPLNLQAEVGSANTFIGQKVSDAAFELNSFVSSLTSSAAYGNSSGISSKYTLVGNGLKEDIILERNTGVVGFKTEYTVSGLTAAADKDGSLCFTDQTGKSVYSVSSPYVFDAAGSICPAVSVTLRQILSGYAVTYTPDGAWMSSDERVYPITFDPLVSDSSLNKSRLTATAYTDNGTTVTKANNSISVGFDKSLTPNKRTYTGLYIAPSAYPQVDTDHYEVKNMTLTLTVKERTGTVMLRSCLLKQGENPLSAGFTPSGTMSSFYTVSSSTTATEISLPLDYYKNQNQSTPTYLLMPFIPASGSGARSVTYYGPAETNVLKHPVLKVSYSLRESFDEKVGFISRTDGGITRYLSVDENNNLTASITPYRWIFEEYLTGYGEYLIRSYENSGVCLKTGTNGTVSAVSYPVLPEEPSTSYFWAPVLYDNALGSYLFYSNTGGFLHLNTTDYSLTLSSTSGIDDHAWVVLEDVSLDVGNFTFENISTHSHLSVGQSAGQTVPALTTAPSSYDETWIPIKLDDGCYRFRTQTDSEKYLIADGTVLTVGTATDDSSKWRVRTDQQSGGYCLMNKSTETFLTDSDSGLSLVTANALSESGYLWKFADFFALRAEPDDKVEFALHHISSDKYLQYGSIFTDTSEKTLTAETFNAVVDETVVDSTQSYNYTAQTRSVCQRFTFEKVGDGDSAYYHILPLLRVDDEIKCVYRTEYRLVAENGTVKVGEMTVTDGTVGDPTSGRWLLERTDGGKYRIKNVAAGAYLNVENNIVCLTAQRPKATMWDLKAISLAMEKDYQQYTNTCGAASGKMIVNYLIKTRNIDVSSYSESTFCDYQFIQKYEEVNPGINYSSANDIGYIRKTINSIVGSQLYTDSWNALNKKALCFRIANSLNQGCPVIIQIKPLEEQASAVGYYYKKSDDKGHYFVVKGCYYNSTTGEYDSVVNETNYKFGATSVSKYSSTKHSHPQPKAPGGRDLVISSDILHTIYNQRHHGMIYKA